MNPAVMAVAALSLLVGGPDEPRPRIRDLGVTPGVLHPGPLNAITDVAGVRVGHRTIVEGESVRTGVTAIIPIDGDMFRQKVAAAVYVGNGFGKAAGFLQVQELGNIETPIVLTNTLSVGRAVETVVRWTLDQPGNESVRSVNAVVGETNDGWLNDIRGMHVTADDVVAAIDAAEGGPVAEGSIGAGTGTLAFGWKGGIGTSSRLLPESLGGHTIGVLVQSNFGGILTIDGVRVGEALGRHSFRDALEEADGSCMIVVATDAPLSSRNLERMARRAVLGLARTGSFMSNGSGDFVIAFSTSRDDARLENAAMSPLFLAVVEATEEAVYNSLTKATTVTGREGHTATAIPIDKLAPMFAKTPPEPGKLRGVSWVAGRQITEESLAPLVTRNVNTIAQTPFGWQASADAPGLRLVTGGRVYWGETDEGLRVTTQFARKHGLRTMLKPHVWIRDQGDGAWRGTISMKSDADWQQWFDEYRRFIVHYATFAETNGIDLLCVGTELHSTVLARPDDWRKIIAAVREVYSGKLTYGANWHREFEDVPFWDDLDYIGVHGYFPLSEMEQPSVDDLVAGWQPHIEKINRVRRKFDKPVVFTELGYKSTVDAATRPWEWPSRIPEDRVDTGTQAKCYEAFYRVFWHLPWFEGVYWWKWFPDHARGRTGGFTPQEKPAEAVMTRWFGGTE
jgi:D-aminopeptidase